LQVSTDYHGLLSGDGDLDNLIVCPGAVRVYRNLYRCVRVTYTWVAEERNWQEFEWPNTITGVLELAPIQQLAEMYPSGSASSFPPLLLQGQFKRWSDTEIVELVPFNSLGNPSWRVVSDTSGTDGGGLAANVLLPAAQQDKYEGVYIRYGETTAMHVLLVPGATPIALGGKQRYAPKLEGAAIVINAPTVVVTSGQRDVPVQGAPDGKISLCSPKEVFLSQINDDGSAGNTLKLTANSVETDKDMKVRGQLDSGAD